MPDPTPPAGPPGATPGVDEDGAGQVPENGAATASRGMRSAASRPAGRAGPSAGSAGVHRPHRTDDHDLTALDQFIEARLVTADGDRVEITHEALRTSTPTAEPLNGTGSYRRV
jgi:hypothetical protein